MANNVAALSVGEKYYNTFIENLPPSYRAANLVFAYYAAFPLVFSPDMLYQLWLNFQDYKQNESLQLLPMVVVSDLLQSGFCQEVAFELYELDADFANYLKNNIDQLQQNYQVVLLYSHRDMAVFTLNYAKRYLQHPNSRNLHSIYYWKSLLEADPEKANEEIKDVLKNSQKSSSEEQNILLYLADKQAERQNAPELSQDYNKLPVLAYQPTADSREITDKDIIRQIVAKLGMKPDVAEPTPTLKTAQQRIQQAKATNATQLDLSGLELTQIPSEINELINLKELNLSNNQITRIENLDQLPNLQRLDISQNQITKLENLDQLPNLQQLYISFNKITKLENLDYLPSLQELYISFNKITKLENLDQLPNLQRLDIRENQITKLENLDHVPNLQYLDIEANNITKLENLDRLPNLQQLNISQNQITKLENLDQLPNLQRLDISQNQITYIENLEYLPKLEVLDIRDNQITKLENLDQLPNLQRLDISQNQITKLENLDQLFNLHELYISYNKITKLENLEKLLNLQQLDISNNQITDLSPLLPLYQKGAQISIENNPLTNPPMDIVKQGVEAILKYFALPQPIQQLIKNMVLVEGGTFTMGSPGSEANRYDDEQQHQVTLSDFYIGAYQVTQAQWVAVMGNNPSHFKGDNLPVENVSWDDIQVFLTKLNEQTGKEYRLPTEAEWEYAARGGKHSKGFKYAGSNDLNEVAWYDSNSGNKTHPVGQKKPNELGLYDMSGNVWEWCGDWYAADYYKNSPAKNPTGPASGANRVLRGGSWGSYAPYCRVAHRYDYTPTNRGRNFGFRLSVR